MPELLLLVDDVEVRRYRLWLGRIMLGRASSADIVVDDQTVSQRHAVIECSAETGQFTCHVQDLNSTNGTLIDGEKIRRSILLHGQILGLGWIRFRFVDR